MLFNNCKETIIKFEFFFIIAFFFTNYVYSLFYYPINPYFSHFALPFNEGYISRGIALSTVGICSFNLGVFQKNKLLYYKRNFINDFFISPKNITIALIVLFLPYMFTLIRRHVYTTEFETSLINVILVYLVYFSIFYVTYISRRCNSLLELCKKNRYNLLVYFIVIYSISFLLLGSRTIPLRIVMLALFLVSVYVKHIKSLWVYLLITVGAFFMTFLGVIRDGSEFGMSSLTSLFDLGQDLTINNRSLYVLMEYADTNGITWGKSLLMNLLSVIPFGQRIYLILTGDSLSNISSATLVTDLYFNDVVDKERVGLGTNIVGDVYLAFGLLGVLFLFFLFGKVINYLYKKGCSGNNLYVLLYGLVFMDAIYYPRSGILTSIRPIVWVYFIYFIFKRTKPSQKNASPGELANLI